jgi:hypothetical protein
MTRSGQLRQVRCDVLEYVLFGYGWAWQLRFVMAGFCNVCCVLVWQLGCGEMRRGAVQWGVVWFGSCGLLWQRLLGFGLVRYGSCG